MSRLFAAVAAIAIAVTTGTPAQEKSTPPPKAKSKGIDVPGYEQRTVEGFYLLINKKVFAEIEAAKGKYEIGPMEVLEGELKALNTILVPKILAAMKTVRVFVEWDELPPGVDLDEEEKARAGRVVALYRSGTPLAVAGQSLVKQLKLNAVEIMTLKRLTEMHQPGRDRDQIILLHELCHTAHHHFLRFDNLDIRTAFQQAMDRDLYGQVYARTNEREYFAEISCAYLDKCNHFPVTADDLKGYDPVGYQLMEKVWGKQEQIAKLRDRARQEREYREKLKARAAPTSVKGATDAPAERKPAESKPVDAGKAAATKLALAKDFIKDGKKDKARDRLNALIRDYPDTAAAKEAKTLLDGL